MKIPKKSVVGGSIFTVVAIIVSIISVHPDRWKAIGGGLQSIFKNIGVLIFNNYNLLMIGVGVGFVAGIAAALLLRKTGADHAQAPQKSHILTSSGFERECEKIILEKEILEIMIFGYTQETVSNYLKYDILKDENLRIRILNRSWYAEKQDEISHNEKFEKVDIRQWDKSEKIRKSSEIPWTHGAKREARFYDYSHPMIKGVILKSKTRKWAFISFYEWQENPVDGGSTFKGSALDMISLCEQDDMNESVIQYLVSQFELIWKYRSMTVNGINKLYQSYIDSGDKAQ